MKNLSGRSLIVQTVLIIQVIFTKGLNFIYKVIASVSECDHVWRHVAGQKKKIEGKRGGRRGLARACVSQQLGGRMYKRVLWAVF